MKCSAKFSSSSAWICRRCFPLENLRSICQLTHWRRLDPAPEPAAKGVYTDGATSITGVIRAMEQDGVLKTLAEPNLTAVSGQPAKFHAGGEVPVPDLHRCIGGSQRLCEINSRNLAYRLAFTPVVLSEGRINLKITTEVSELSSRAIDGITSFDTRSSETVIELPSGGSMMLAGLIKDTTRQKLMQRLD